MKKLKEEILKLIDAKRWNEIEELLLSSEKSNILKIIKTIYCKEGLHLLNGILKSLQCKTQESTSLKSMIYENVLTYIKSNEDNEKENGKLVTVLNMHVDTFPSEVLVNLIDLYLEHLSAGLPFYGRWTEFLGKLLSTATSRDDIVVDGKALNCEDFRYKILSQLCDFKWSARTTISLLPILKDAALPKEELKDVVEKLRSVLREVDYPSVPPIAYHAVLLGQGPLAGAVLEMVMSFFNEQETTLRKKSVEDDSESLLDADEADKIEKSTLADLVEAQGTVILHITQLAQYDPDLMKEYLKGIKCTWVPEKIFTPFNLALALSLAHIERYKDKIIDSLKRCILSYFRVEQQRQKSFWLRDAFQTPFNLMEIFRTTVNNCKGGWDQVSESLVVLCFRLLECGGGLIGETPPRRQTVALATSVLPLVFKKEPRLAPDILKQVSSLVLTSSSSMQYVDLLGQLVRASPLILLDYVPLVRELLEQLPFLQRSVALALLEALHPLLKMSMPLKDALIIVLRKMLFSRQVDNRTTAVRGFLQILRHFRILGTLPSSQASMSFSSTLSQVSADVHSALDSGTNEALCLELLGVLRRVFTQQSEVRSTLYDGLYDVVRANPKLGPSIVRFLQQHLKTFVDNSQDVINPLMMQKAINGKAETAVLVEPLGELLSCLVRCKIRFLSYRERASEEDDDDDEEGAEILSEVQVSFDTLTEFLAYCDLNDLELGTGASQLDHLRAQVYVGALDALMEENFCSGALCSEDKMKKFLKLFKTQRKIVNLLRDRAKTGKKDKGEATKSKGKAVAGASKNAPAPTIKSILSLNVVVAMLRAVLVGDVSADQRCVDLIKGNVELEAYLVSVVAQAVAGLKETLPSHREKLLPDLRAASALLLKECERCLGCDDDEDAGRFKCFVSGLHTLVSAFVKYYKDKLPQIFREMAGKSPAKEYDKLLYSVGNGCLKMTLRVLQNEGGQATFLKEAILLAQVVGQVAEQMSPSCPQLTELMDAVKQLCKDQEVDNALLAQNLIELLLGLTERVHMKSSVVRSLARAVHHRLGDIEEDVDLEEASDYNLVTETSAEGVLTAICAYCEEVFSVLDMALSKLRECLVAGVNFPDEDMDRRVCLKLLVIIHTLHEVFQSACPGQSQQNVLRTSTKFYSCITSYVKYQLVLFRSKSNKQMSEKFETLIRQCAELLKDKAFKMIIYTQNAQATKKKSQPARAHKETRLIPDLVYAMELYENQLLLLTRKSKVDLLAGTKITTSRDFRIIADAIKPTEEEDADESVRENADENHERGSEEEGENERTPSPPPKKKKKQK